MRKVALKLIPLIAAIALLALLALGVVSASANAPSGSISFEGTATLVSNPGPANVTLHYSCLPPPPGSLVAGLDENGVLSLAFTTPTCDGKNHSVTLTMSSAFTPGTAAGLGYLINLDGSVYAYTYQKVLIK
jgi:hypothetical protein